MENNKKFCKTLVTNILIQILIFTITGAFEALEKPMTCVFAYIFIGFLVTLFHIAFKTALNGKFYYWLACVILFIICFTNFAFYLVTLQPIELYLFPTLEIFVFFATPLLENLI